MSIDNFDVKQTSRALKEVEENVILDDSGSIKAGDEVEFIKNLQKQLEDEQKFEEKKEYELYGKDLNYVLNENVTNKFKTFFNRVFNVFQYLGILIVIFIILSIASIFKLPFYIMIPAYFLSIIILTVYYMFLFKYKIGKSFNKPLEILSEISRGKLSFNIMKDNELKKKLGKFAIPLDTIIKKMSDMVAKVELSALDLAGNSDALTYFAKSMASKTDQQSTSIDQIDDSAKNLNNSMQVIKNSVESAYNISKTSIEEANSSSKEILLLIEEMHRINEMSDKIVTTMNFIDDIAAETNLLALNAAIQAAHAGEEGKGFGVVAAEIKNLAQSSSKATKTIYQIVENTVDSIAKGVQASEKAKKELMKIVSSLQSTEDLMSKINDSINLQSNSTNQLKENLANIFELTKNINSDTQNMKSAISNLSGQAQILTTLISYFDINKSENIRSDAIIGVEK